MKEFALRTLWRLNMMRKQMPRRLGRIHLKKEHTSQTLRNAYVLFVMKLFLLHIG